MPTLLRSRKPRARSRHRCSCCSGTIAPGITYDRDTLIYDGRIYDWLTCMDCAPLTDAIWRWSNCFGDEGITSADYEEWAFDHRNDPEHGSAARALLDRMDVKATGT